MGNMVQYSVWSNCCNNCDFCLRRERIPYSREKQLLSLRSIRKNLDYVDWQNKFSDGISLLGGELYYIEDKELRYKFSLCKYIMENTLFNHRDCIASHELGKLFANFYGKFLTNEDIEDLINSLVKFDMVSITNKGTFKWLKFNMSNIKEFYENH